MLAHTAIAIHKADQEAEDVQPQHTCVRPVQGAG